MSNKIIWKMTMGYAGMKLPFAVGDRVSHHGQRVEITSIKKNGADVEFIAVPTTEKTRLAR